MSQKTEPNSRAPVLLNLSSLSRISDKILDKPRISSRFAARLITYHLLEHQGGVETQTREARVMTTLRGLADISLSENHYCIRSFSRLKTCNNVFEIEHFSRSKTYVK